MKLSVEKAKTIGLVEVPALGLYDSDGRNWTPLFQDNPLLSKQILLADLQAGGFNAQLFNLNTGDYQEEFGQIDWGRMTLSKVYVGKRIFDLDPEACDAWGVTSNYLHHRQIACILIKHLSSRGRPVVVGGSDVIASTQDYFQAGATAAVLDKSGAANLPVFDYVLGKTPREKLTGVVFADGSSYPRRNPSMHPQDWPLPSLEVVKQCLGTKYTADRFLEDVLPMGSVFPDIGCDRKCDFCQTPKYGTGYRRMTPQRALEWLALQKEAGARSSLMVSDQFLGRVLFPEGREEVLEITLGAREMGMPLLWYNGLELRKATLGRGLNYEDTDLTPDQELVEALWGWDGKVGAITAYIPAERPINGKQGYSKLLPWQQHCTMMQTIVRAGLPIIVYGVIIGLPEDSHEHLLHLEQALQDLYQQLIAINPSLEFQVAAYSITPIPGTGQWDYMAKSGLLRFDDPCIMGGFWTPSCDTHYLSYEEIADWQARLAEIGKDTSKLNNHLTNTGVWKKENN